MGKFKLGWGTAVILTLILAAIVAAFFIFVDIATVIKTVRSADLLYLLAALVGLLVGLGFFALRWRLLMGNKPSFTLTFLASNLALFFNMIIPARGGELLRIIMIGQKSEVTYTEATTSVAVERLIEQVLRILFLLLAVAVGVGLVLNVGAMVGTAVFVAAFIVLIVWALRHRATTLRVLPRVLSKLPKVEEAPMRESLAKTMDNLQIIARPKQLLAVGGYSLLAWGAFTLFYYAILAAIDFPGTERWPVVLASLALGPPSATTHPGIAQASIVVPLSALGFAAAPLTAYMILAQLLEAFLMGTLALTAVFYSGLSFGRILSAEESQI